MKKLQLWLLGHPRVHLNGREITAFKTRKDCALLIYLAATNASHSRWALTGLLWPEMPEEKARNSLRTSLYNLRKQLGSEWFDTTHGGIGLDQSQPIWVDTFELQKYVKNGLDNIQEENVDDFLSLCQKEFLHGFHISDASAFEDWATTQAEQGRLLAQRGLEALVQKYLKEEKYKQGITLNQQLLQLDPLSESAHRLQMLLLTYNDEQMAALSHYAQCQRILQDELGVQPSDETTALYEKLKAQLQSGVSFTDPVASVTHSTTSGIDFSPLSSEIATTKSASIPNNLPVPLAAFIGRTSQKSFIHQQLSEPDSRLLTIVGPGGIGKTSLALECGQKLLESSRDQFPDGIFFISLAETVRTIGQTVVQDGAGSKLAGAAIQQAIVEQINSYHRLDLSTQQHLADYLRTQKLLIILDNIEHLVSGIEAIVDLMTKAPEIKILVTSRVRLNIRGETILELDRLPLGTLSINTRPKAVSKEPDALWADGVRQESEAIEMFVQRVQCIDPTFAITHENIGDIVEICQLVDGLPLALEMIAAWISYLSCAEIAQQLKKKQTAQELLTSSYTDHPQRHDDLQTVFDDSWKLLPLDAQHALAQLTVFSNKFTWEFAQAIAAISLSQLACLRNHSLIQFDHASRYSMHPLLRQFAAEKWQQLTANRPDRRRHLHQTHSRYFLQYVERIASSDGEEELKAIRATQKNHAEVVCGWKWAAQYDDTYHARERMLGLFRYLELTNQPEEGKALFDCGAPRSTETDPESLTESAATWRWIAHCHFLRRLGEYEQARLLLEKVVAILSAKLGHAPATQLDSLPSQNKSCTRAQITPDTENYTFVLCSLGWVYYETGEYDSADDYFSAASAQAEILTRDHGEAFPSQWYIAQALNGLGSVAFSTRRYSSAESHYQAALKHAQEQNDLHCTAIILGNLAAHAHATHAYDVADHFLQQRIQIDTKTHNVRQMAVSYQRLGQLALQQADYAKAEVYLRRSSDQFEQLGRGPEVLHVLLDLGRSLLRQNQIQQAEAQCLRSLQLAIDAELTPRILAALTLLAEIRSQEGKKHATATLVEMVRRNEHIPAATERTANRLRESVVIDLGEEALSSIQQEIADVPLEEFGSQCLLGQ